MRLSELSRFSRACCPVGLPTYGAKHFVEFKGKPVSSVKRRSRAPSGLPGLVPVYRRTCCGTRRDLADAERPGPVAGRRLSRNVT